MQKNRHKKFVKSKIKPEVLIVASVFLVVCIYFLGVSVKNILFVISQNNINDQSSTTIQTNQAPLQRQVRPQTNRNEIFASELPENPVRTVRSILGDSIQINDSDQWYQVGDVVEGITRIVAIEQTRVLIEYNGIQSYVSLDFSRMAANQQDSTSGNAAGRLRTQTTYVGTGQMSEDELEEVFEQSMEDWEDSLSPAQQARIESRMERMEERFSREEMEALESRMEELMQRVVNMPGAQQQTTIERITRQLQDWVLSDSDDLPGFLQE